MGSTDFTIAVRSAFAGPHGILSDPFPGKSANVVRQNGVSAFSVGRGRDRCRVHGRCIIAVVYGQNEKLPGTCVPGSFYGLVAGTGFEPVTFRL